jgi:hypothetical protein
VSPASTPRTETITVETYLNFKVGDPVQFSVVNSQTGGAGTLARFPPGLALATTYYVIAYTASTGALQVSATAGGAAVNITDDGTAAAPNEFQVAYAEFAVVGQVRDWSFEISRAEIDVTTIGQTPGQYVPFRSYISGFGDGSGTATVYMTNEDAALSNRMVEDVLQRQQNGAAFKLYTDRVYQRWQPERNPQPLDQFRRRADFRQPEHQPGRRPIGDRQLPSRRQPHFRFR